MSCAAFFVRTSSGSIAKSFSMSSLVVTHAIVTERSNRLDDLSDRAVDRDGHDALQ